MQKIARFYVVPPPAFWRIFNISLNTNWNHLTACLDRRLKNIFHGKTIFFTVMVCSVHTTFSEFDLLQWPQVAHYFRVNDVIKGQIWYQSVVQPSIYRFKAKKTIRNATSWWNRAPKRDQECETGGQLCDNIRYAIKRLNDWKTVWKIKNTL